MSGREMFSGRHLSVIRGGRRLLDDISLDIRKGEVLGLIGPNGAGKSTLLRVLSGLLPSDMGVVSGVAHHHGRDVAYLPQQPVTGVAMTVRDVVALGRLPHRRSDTVATRSSAIDRALQAVGMAGLGDRLCEGLSGGERARVLLARTLAVEAPYLLADEPVAALDPAHALDVMGLFTDHARNGGSCVVVLHDLALATRFCTRIAVLSAGRLVADGSPAEVLTDDLFAEVYGVSVRRYGDIALPWERLERSGQAR